MLVRGVKDGVPECGYKARGCEMKQKGGGGCNTYPLPKKRQTPNMDEALLSTNVDEEFCDCGLGWCSAVYRGKLTF